MGVHGASHTFMSRGGPAARGAIGISLATAAGQAIFLLISPVLTRMYSPDAFGLFTVLTAVIAVLAVVSTLRLELAVPLAPSNREARRVVVAGVSAAFLICLVAGGIVSLNTGAIAGAFAGIDAAGWLWVVPVSAFLFGSYEIVSQYAVRHKRYSLLGKRSFVQGAGMSAAQLGFGFFSVRGGLLLGQMVGKAAAIAFMLPGLRLVSGIAVRDMSLRTWKRSMRANWRFPLFLMPSALLNTLGTQIPFVLIGLLYGAPIVGLLGLTQRVLAAPASLIGQAVSNVYMGESAKTHRTATGSNYRFFMKTSTILAIVGVPFFGVVFLVAPSVFELVFGQEWQEAGYYAQAMSLSFLLQFVVGPVSQTLIINNAQLTQLMWDSGRLAVVTGAIVAASAFGADALLAVWIYSATSAIAYVILWLLCLGKARSRVGA